MDFETWNKQNQSNTGGGNGNGPGNTGGNTSGPNPQADTLITGQAIERVKMSKRQMEYTILEAPDHLAAENKDPPKPQPDERITQAEYEKVVKGARLTDPVEEPISRSCTERIQSVCLEKNKPLFACKYHIHFVDDNNNEQTDDGCKICLTKGDYWRGVAHLLYADTLIVLCTSRKPLSIYMNDIFRETKHSFSEYC